MEIDFKVAKTPPGQPRVLVVCGLQREARLAAASNAVVVAGGGDAGALRRRLDAIDPLTLDAVVSFGLAGALAPALKVGDVVVPDTVVDLSGRQFPTSDAIREEWLRQAPRLATADPAVTLVGVDRPALTAADKRNLRRRAHGAEAVDMESHLAAAYAAEHGLAFAALRVISDEADRDLPALAGTAMRSDGSIAVGRVLGGLLTKPGQIPGLLATARDARTAFAALEGLQGLLQKLRL